MRLDEAVKVFCDGKKVEHDGGEMSWINYAGQMDVLAKGTHIQVKRLEGNNHPGVPVDGWRLKRETLNPMQAWERMKAGKVVRSDAQRSCYRSLAGVLMYRDLDESDGWNQVRGLFGDFMNATDLYEVEDES